MLNKFLTLLVAIVSQNALAAIPCGTVPCMILGQKAEDSGNLVGARFYYYSACTGGLVAGCQRLGELFQKDKNYGSAQIYYNMGCAYKYAPSCKGLGDVETIENDPSAAKVAFDKACAIDSAFCEKPKKK